MRLIGLAALGRLLYSLGRTVSAELRNPENLEFRALLGLVGVVVAGGGLFYHLVERWTLLDSLYFSVVTLATVGYGDLSPKTALGKAFTILYILAGMGILAGFVHVLAGYRVRRAARAAEGLEREGQEVARRTRS